MFYLVMFIKVFILEYIIILCHEIIHYICSILFGFKVSFFHVIPFTLYKRDNHIRFSFIPKYESGLVSRTHFDSVKLVSSISYTKLKNNLRIVLFAGPIFDYSIFIILFVLGVSLENSLYLSLTAILHFCIASITFFNSDGKYAVGSNEDSRICFSLISSVTLFGNGDIKEETKRIMTDKYLEISKGIDYEGFNVNDLWNFLNNIEFYTRSLCCYLNKDLHVLDENLNIFMESLIRDIDKINYLDYRQTSKVAKTIIIYLIYKKQLDNNFEPQNEFVIKIIKYCNSKYLKLLFNYYFTKEQSINPSDIEFLYNDYNMPTICRNCQGYSKTFYNIISNKK